jgi:hypothetical protein
VGAGVWVGVAAGAGVAPFHHSVFVVDWAFSAATAATFPVDDLLIRAMEKAVTKNKAPSTYVILITILEDLEPKALPEPPAKIPPMESESSSCMMTRKIRRRQAITKRISRSTAKKLMITTPEYQD